MNELLSEAIGTFVLILFGCGVNAGTSLKNSYSKKESNSWTVGTLGWGLAVTLGVYASQYSGKENMILQWGGYTYDGYVYDRVGGVNRCGAYCTKWGCGQKHDQFYNQMECGV